MTRIIVITSGKGGVGKSTTTSNLGMALARTGKKVLVIDGDINLRNLDLLLGLEHRVIYTGVDVASGKCHLSQALVSDKRERNLTFFPLAPNRTNIKLTGQNI
jgi:septum site-determining protein MinD